MKNDKHYRQIPKDVLEKAKKKIDEVAEMLKPYLLALTPEERQEILKMGPKTLNFVEKSYEYAKENKNLVPPYLDMESFDIDFADAQGLWSLYNRVSQLKEGIADTQTVAGSESLQASLVFYNSVKTAANQNVTGAKAVYDELRQRFPGNKRQTKSKTEV